MAGDPTSPRVQVHPADEGGCPGGYYRLRWVSEVLQHQGHDVTVGGSLPGQFDPRTHQLVGVDPVDADVVVLQRPLKRILADLIPHLQAQGVAVVVEVDDDFHALPPANPAWAANHPRRSPDRNWEHLMRACAVADLVTVTTPALARRYGAHGRCHILPNYVPERYLGMTPGAPNEHATVGWTGTPATHPGDLEVTGGRVAPVLAETGARFRAIGSAATLGVLGVPEDRGEVVEWAPLVDGYPQAVAGLDVGIVPLRPSMMNNAKSWLKGIEMAALGVPFAASDTPEYRRLHGLGAGLLCDKPRHWEGTLRRLLTLPDLRADLAGRGREAAARMTIEGNAWRWTEAWGVALANRRGRRAA